MRLQNGAPVYKVGTKVRVRIVDKPDYKAVKFVTSMECYRGLELTISSIYCDKKYPYYEVRENTWWWDDSMLDCIVEDFESEEDSELAGASFGRYFEGFTIK